MTSDEERLTVYYDGNCPLCRAEIAHYRRQQGAEVINFANVADQETILPTGLDRKAALARFHVRDLDGNVVSGAAAFRLVWRVLPQWRLLARISSLPGVLPLLETVYRVFLPFRPGIARLFSALKTG